MDRTRTGAIQAASGKREFSYGRWLSGELKVELRGDDASNVLRLEFGVRGVLFAVALM